MQDAQSRNGIFQRLRISWLLLQKSHFKIETKKRKSGKLRRTQCLNPGKPKLIFPIYAVAMVMLFASPNEFITVRKLFGS